MACRQCDNRLNRAGFFVRPCSLEKYERIGAMPDEYAPQSYANIAESAAAGADTITGRDGIFGHHKNGAIPVTYRTLSAAGTVPAIYRLNRCAASPRLSVILSAHCPDSAGD